MTHYNPKKNKINKKKHRSGERCEYWRDPEVVNSHLWHVATMGPFHYVRLERHFVCSRQLAFRTRGFSPRKNKKNTVRVNSVNTGGIDGARTRDLLRDRTKTVMLICFESY